MAPAGPSGEEYVRTREVRFRGPHREPDQARAAALLLAGREGVLEARPITPECLQVTYDLRATCLEALERLVADHGLHLDGSLLTRLKRALWYYSDEAARAALGSERGRGNCTDRVFAAQYRRHRHGCRDSRPEHWRRYL